MHMKLLAPSLLKSQCSGTIQADEEFVATYVLGLRETSGQAMARWNGWTFQRLVLHGQWSDSVFIFPQRKTAGGEGGHGAFLGSQCGWPPEVPSRRQRLPSEERIQAGAGGTMVKHGGRAFACVAKLPPMLAVACYGYEGFVFNRILLPWAGNGTQSLFAAGALTYNLLWLLSFISFLRGCLTDPGLLDSDWWRGRDDSSLRSSLRQDWALLPCRHCGPRPERSHHCKSCGGCILRHMEKTPTPAQNIFGILLPPVRMPRLLDMEVEQQQLIHEAGLLSIACGLAASFCVALGGLFLSNFYDTLRNRTSIESRFAGDFSVRHGSPGVREEDLLDSTFTLTDTSRLGCQVRLTEELDGIQCTLPDSGAKGNVRMTLEMPRPKVQMQLPGAPAVAPSVKRGGTAQPTVEELLKRQEALSARLEAHLREIQAKAARRCHATPHASKPEETNASDNSGQSAEEEKEDLSKLKAELQKTRVETEKLGRKARFEDVIGLAAAKEAIKEAILWPAMARRELFSGVRSGPKGLLLYGPPGCGKTMLARAAAVELEGDASFFHIRPGDVMSKFYGESQKRVQALEEVVQEAAPAVVFFDEVDSLLGSRDGGGVAEHHRSTTNALLSWMDGFGTWAAGYAARRTSLSMQRRTGDERVFFLGATNRAEAIDEAALRRFGEAVEVGTPSLEARIALIQHLVFKKASRCHK
eukprot:g3729.t1